MKRRDFLLAAAVVAAPRSSLDFSQLPNFCSHEHWGSIDSIGTFPGGYRADIEPGAVPKGEPDLWICCSIPTFEAGCEAAELT
jgi:hypothetical protein